MTRLSSRRQTAITGRSGDVLALARRGKTRPGLAYLFKAMVFSTRLTQSCTDNLLVSIWTSGTSGGS